MSAVTLEWDIAARLAAIVESDTGFTCQLWLSVDASNNGLKHRGALLQYRIASTGIRRTKLHLIAAALQNVLPARKLKFINLSSFWNANRNRC
tara:strand:- start:41477 stop:41755 length:279 start_codon:yes stop_codon:yes gene_type:complete